MEENTVPHSAYGTAKVERSLRKGLLCGK